MKILAYFGHPSQYLFLKNSIQLLRKKGHFVTIVIKSKDVLETLLKHDNESYINILKEGRRDNKISIFFALLKRDFRLSKIVVKDKPDLLIGTDPSLAHVGKMFKIPCLTCLEDDFSVIHYLANLTYPFTRYIIAPIPCNVGKWHYKKIGYDGYMKLAYLHPDYFKPDKSVIEKITKNDFSLIRLPNLSAHHDIGIEGLNNGTLDKIIELLSKKGEVFISAERTLENKYEKYRLNIDPSEIHHFLYYSQILISDSQSMSVEAAMLGTPSIRISDFAGEISVLEELEHKYKLSFGIKTIATESLFEMIADIFKINNLKKEFQDRRRLMLSEKINVTKFMVWLIEKYPESTNIMMKNPDYQYNFK